MDMRLWWLIGIAAYVLGASIVAYVGSRWGEATDDDGDLWAVYCWPVMLAFLVIVSPILIPLLFLDLGKHAAKGKE